VRQELAETLYHVVWELVHVFFEHQGLLSIHDEDRLVPAPVHDVGASSFLYPFLGRQETDLESVLADVRQSVVMKARDVTALRIDTVRAGMASILDAATLLRSAFDAGRSVIVFGNGGSATDAMDAAADLRFPPSGLRGRPTFDLTEDAAVLTAIANDVGAEMIFSRQIIAYGRPRDVALTFSTSGNSLNVTHALEEARRRGLSTLAFVGYDGGHIQARHLADVVILSPSQYTPRVQEAQATAWHIVRTLVG
jgi:D-sedoheptulose 7-phosphate isomerase